MSEYALEIGVRPNKYYLTHITYSRNLQARASSTAHEQRTPESTQSVPSSSFPDLFGTAFTVATVQSSM